MPIVEFVVEKEDSFEQRKCDQEEKSDSLNPHEREALGLIIKALPESPDLRLERRTPSYLTIVTGAQGDFCRLKATDRAKWFSLDLWCAPDEIKNDERLQIVKNKNQRHWKIPLSRISDIEQYSSFITFAYNENKNY